jgi:hypothetical protein
MRSLLYLVWAGAIAAGCVSPYLDTAAPSDATFALACELPGSAATPGRLRIDVAFANVARHYSFGCEHRAELRARLQTVADLWCDGMPVAPAKVGTLVVATTTSELSDKRGATIDDGEGYVAFQCDGWLPELIAALGKRACCGPLPASAPTSSPPNAPPF